MVIQGVNAQACNFFSMATSIVSLAWAKCSTINTTLQIELLDSSVLIAKDSEVTALRNCNRGDPYILELLRLFHTDFGDAMISIAPQVWLSSACMAGYYVLPVAFSKLTEIKVINLAQLTISFFISYKPFGEILL